MAEHLIEIAGVKKSFGTTPILRGIDLSIEKAELTVLIGPSGCGKSTLMRCLNGLEVFDEGRIRVADVVLERPSSGSAADREYLRRTHALRGQVGMVFQSFNLFPHMTALENVARPPMIVLGTPRDEAYARGLELLDKVGLKERADHYPRHLSGGQQQRAAIARALAMKPSVILYDEPTSALDPGLSDEVLQVMRRLDDEGNTQIVITHEMRFARGVADKVVFIAEGRVVEEGPPAQVFSEPKDERTRKFLAPLLKEGAR